MKSDAELLRKFATSKDEASFAEVVQRHIGFVFAISARRLRDPHLAKDATQGVFVALARKAVDVASYTSITGWLHRCAVFETLNIMRARTNCLAREAEAQRLGTTVSETSLPQVDVDAVLDEVLNELPVDDREAIIARYFSGLSYAEVGTALHSSENAARMRVERALQKLRSRLIKRGVTSTAAALAAKLPTYASMNVPEGLVALVTKAALAGATGAAGTAATITIMSTAKILTGVSVVALSCGFIYQYRRASDLEIRLAEVQSEHAIARTQRSNTERRSSDVHARPVSVQRASGDQGTTLPMSTSAPAKPPPVPGVTTTAPNGWFKNGNAGNLYEVGVDQNNTWGGMPSAYAQSTGDARGKFGGMMQTISARAYMNSRVRLNAWVKTEDANDGGARLWLRVDGKEGKMLGLDNMEGRAPKGTTDWQEHSVVLEVPPDATKVNYGFFVSGNGKMWVNGLTIEPVGTEVPTTKMAMPPVELPASPVNPGFDPLRR